MKKSITLLTILFLSITVSCKTIEPVFPDEPQRKEIETPKTVKDLGKIIAYYESLVQQWEEWAKAAKESCE